MPLNKGFHHRSHNTTPLNSLIIHVQGTHKTTFVSKHKIHLHTFTLFFLRLLVLRQYKTFNPFRTTYLTSGLSELSGLAMVVPVERLDIPYPAMDRGSWV